MPTINRHTVLTKVFGDPQKRIIKGLEKRVKVINTSRRPVQENVKDRAEEAD